MTLTAGRPAIPSADLSIVIPCFNEEETIGEVLDQLARRFPEAELLVVDDGSSDGTAGRAGGCRGVRLLRHPQNRGYGAAIRTACQAASRPYVVWFDADGQHGADMVAALLTRLPDVDCVIGARTGKSPAPWFRRCGVAAICWLARLLTQRHIPDLNCGLRVFRLDLLRHYLHLLPKGFSASATTTIVMLECGHRVAWTPIPALARSGSSRLRLLRDGVGTLLLVLRLVLRLSPWKIFLPLAVGLSLLGLLAGSGRWLLGGGSLFPAAMLLLCGGLALLSGIVAQGCSRQWRQRMDL